MKREKDDKSGKFIQKSDQKRKVRSIRLTDRTYEYLKQTAEKDDRTIADLIEQIAEDKILENNLDNSIEDLKQKSFDVVFSDNFRPRDRYLIKRAFSLLFAINKDFYNEQKTE